MISLLKKVPSATLKLAGAVLGGVGIVTYGIKEITKEERKIAVLGLRDSGKTTYQNYLRRKNTVERTPAEGTYHEEVATFNYKSKKIYIEPGLDVSGSDESIKNLYAEEIGKSNLVFYLFNAEKFITSKDYKEEAKVLLYYVLKKMKKKVKLIILATHVDVLEMDRADLRELLYSEISDVPGYTKKIKGPIPINLLSYSEMNKTREFFYKL
ncbi:GTPase domain-containing protein [Salegentibacter sp. LM13S]|uniref:GTPase domain-containing protein n=1 Tax=Salegentibacter lacus TaxID=2873599 RepID=UPI001CCEFBC2|nr:GTPase domain-containing protein [Salegentibacter lacus]MBZ9631624.1 GTPase domain-containing protein [Salegentibacter lacus]